MKWREYPTETDRKRDQGATGPRAGVMREGQRWGPGPQLRTSWAIPNDLPRRIALVHEEPHGRSWSAADQDQPVKERTSNSAGALPNRPTEG